MLCFCHKLQYKIIELYQPYVTQIGMGYGIRIHCKFEYIPYLLFIKINLQTRLLIVTRLVNEVDIVNKTRPLFTLSL